MKLMLTTFLVLVSFSASAEFSFSSESVDEVVESVTTLYQNEDGYILKQCFEGFQSDNGVEVIVLKNHYINPRINIGSVIEMATEDDTESSQFMIYSKSRLSGLSCSIEKTIPARVKNSLYDQGVI